MGLPKYELNHFLDPGEKNPWLFHHKSYLHGSIMTLWYPPMSPIESLFSIVNPPFLLILFIFQCIYIPVFDGSFVFLLVKSTYWCRLAVPVIVSGWRQSSRPDEGGAADAAWLRRGGRNHANIHRKWQTIWRIRGWNSKNVVKMGGKRRDMVRTGFERFFFYWKMVRWGLQWQIFGVRQNQERSGRWWWNTTKDTWGQDNLKHVGNRSRELGKN